MESDFKLINESFYAKIIWSMSKSKMKKFTKQKIREAAFKYLIAEKNTKSKIKHIIYKKFTPQKYIREAFKIKNRLNLGIVPKLPETHPP